MKRSEPLGARVVDCVLMILESALRLVVSVAVYLLSYQMLAGIGLWFLGVWIFTITRGSLPGLGDGTFCFDLSYPRSPNHALFIRLGYL